MTNQTKISFENTEYAFAAKSDKELNQANFIFGIMGKAWLVNLGLKITPVAIKWGIPFTKAIIRKTIFRQFVGGETLEQTAILFEGMNRGEGSLGQLATNDSLYHNLNSTARDLDALITDLHENPKRYINLSLFSFGGKKKNKN